MIAAKDQVWIEADLHEIETGTVHVHVFAMLPPPAAAALEACIYGRASSVEGAVAEAALVWARAAGAPILSVLAGRALDEADCFHGTEPWGVAGCHGFVGPILVRAGEFDLQSFGTTPLFAGHSFDLDDHELHIIKAVLLGKDGRWQRTLELDGHGARHADDWPDGPPCSDGDSMVVRFAIVLGRAIAADHALAVRQTDNKLVATVHSALAVFVRGAAMNDAQLIEALEPPAASTSLRLRSSRWCLPHSSAWTWQIPAPASRRATSGSTSSEG